MSLYVRVFTNFYSHRKTAKLRAAIGDAAFWLPPRLWAYAAENQPDGDFSAYSAAQIALLIGYTGDATSMLDALLEAGFMDARPLRIHDWHEHNGYHKAFAERAKNAANARWGKKQPETLSPIPPFLKGKETSNASSMLVASEGDQPKLQATSSSIQQSSARGSSMRQEVARRAIEP